MDGKSSRDRSNRWLSSVWRAGWFVSGMAVLGACLVVRHYWPAESAAAAGKAPNKNNVRQATATQPLKTPAVAAPRGVGAVAPKKLTVVAMVNDEPISREDLARECLLHYGRDVLESIVNRMLILTSCQQRNIEVTQQQIDEEIDRLARKFAMGKDQWLKMLKQERGITPVRYAKDIIWPTLALRELAKAQLTVSKEELDEAFEGEFGPAVKVRLIAMDSATEVRRVHAEAVAKPEEFPALAKRHSQDSNSASAYGLIQPIRLHSGDPNLEKIAFGLKPGEISPIVQIGDLHVFVKCEEHLPPNKKVSRAEAEPLLAEALKDRKLREAAGGVFKKLQDEAKIAVVYGDPVKSKEMPGVAAVVNGQSISLLELAEECIDRHGSDVLEGTIQRRLLDQSLRRRKLTVNEAELQAEIARAAASMGKVNAKGEPDVAGWVEFLTKSQGITREVYVRDEVWPSVALKKLAGDAVQVTQDDLKKGFEANYGPKVRCRAIVLNNQRRAQDVWDKAREAMNDKDQAKALKVFGDLAEQYSVEVGSRSLRGEVPPIQRHGGQPVLEKEAFLLKPGELSGIVQVGEAYIILLCEGHTEPIKTSFEEVKDILYRDIHEKKQRITMAKLFESLKENARIDNFLAGTSKVPKREEQQMAEQLKGAEVKVGR
ncbi:MAG: peptidylprolyl isomerase [Pirellulales bacterium]